ncbi:MAG: hypothetical protein ACYDGR_00885 [Candidatus Dormibacteria bacterium]
MVTALEQIEEKLVAAQVDADCRRLLGRLVDELTLTPEEQELMGRDEAQAMDAISQSPSSRLPAADAVIGTVARIAVDQLRA